MIAGYCRTNLDEYKRERWPEQFVAVPENGQQVKAKSGKTLAVVAVTHCYGRLLDFSEGPYIVVELHLLESDVEGSYGQDG